MQNTRELTLPAHWGSALINSDPSGLSDEDCQALDRFTDDFERDNGTCHCIDMSDEVEFSRWHDAAPYGVKACEVATFVFWVGERR